MKGTAIEVKLDLLRFLFGAHSFRLIKLWAHELIAINDRVGLTVRTSGLSVLELFSESLSLQRTNLLDALLW